MQGMIVISGCGRRLEAQRLIDRAGNQRRITADRLPLFRILEQDALQGREGAARRVAATEQDGKQLRTDFDLAQFTGLSRRIQEVRDEILSRVRPPLLDGVRDKAVHFRCGGFDGVPAVRRKRRGEPRRHPIDQPCKALPVVALESRGRGDNAPG